MADQLDTIKAEALADAPANDAPPAAPGQAGPQLTQEQLDEQDARSWAEIPATFGAIVTMPMPELAEVYSDDNCMEWGRAMVPIARKYNWQAGAGMAWLKLLGCTFMLVKPTVQAIAKRRAQEKAASTGPNAGASAPAATEQRKPSNAAPVSIING